MFLVLPADHPQAVHERVALRALRDERWITGANDSDPSTRLLSWACIREGFEPTHAIRTHGYEAQVAFVAAGLGVALVPFLGLVGLGDNIAARPVDGVPLARHIGVVMLRAHMTDGAGRLLAALRTEAERIRVLLRGRTSPSP